VTVGNAVDSYRLSPQQLALWKALRGAGAGWACAVDIEGALDTQRLRSALDSCVARHEILRTRLVSVAGMDQPAQQIDASSHFDLDLDPCTYRAERALADAVSRWSATPPRDVFAARLFHRSPESHVLALSLPALLADAASLGVLFADIAAAYGASAVAAPELQYADFAAWQWEMLSAPETESGRAFWGEHAVRAADAAATPFAGIAASGASGHVLGEEGVLDPAAVRAAQGLAEGRGWNLRDVLLAAWRVAAAHATGRWRDGGAVLLPGRGFEELTGVVGPVAQRVTLPARLEPSLPFERLVEQTSQDLDAMERHLQYRAAHESGAVRGGWTFAWHELDCERRAGAVVFRLEDFVGPVDVAPLRLDLRRCGEQVRARVCFERACVHDSAPQAAVRCLSSVLVQAAADPAATVESLVPKDDGNSVWASRGEEAALPQDDVVHMFEKQVAARPEATALVYEDRRWSYRELDEWAGAIQARLGAAVPESGARVAVLIERSDLYVAVLLAVMRNGAVCVALDPSMPGARVAAILEDAHCRALLTAGAWQGKVPDGIQLLRADEADESGTDVRARPSARPRGDAYLLHTSGSSGRPKGVLVTHAQLAAYVGALTHRLGVHDPLSYAMVSSFAADLGYTALFPALCTGGCLHVVSEQRVVDPVGMAEYMQRHAVDVMKITPSHLRALMRLGEPQRLLPEKWLILGGEPCRWETVQAVRSSGARCEIVNHYGPTETTIGVCTFLVPDADSGCWSATVPIGTALPNMRLAVLAPDGDPVAEWCAGELCVAGVQVSRGYADGRDPDGRFGDGPPADPVWSYRTGDQVRRLPGGVLEFVGRRDRQVKVHGFRIELDEIESVLAQHPGVPAAAVIRHGAGESDHPRLAAYVTWTGAQDPAAELRRFLGERLPEYMVPASITVLDALPRTASGKLDRARLPAPHEPPGSRYVAPRDDTERGLAAVWQDVLGVERVGVRDNFFELGGDSIHSIQIIAKAYRLGLRLSPNDIFECPTVEELARQAKAVGADRAAAEPATGEVALTPIQHWFFEQRLPDPGQYNLSVVLEAAESVDALLFRRAAQAAAAAHSALALRFRRDGADWVQCIEERSPRVHLEVHDDFPVNDVAAVDAAGRRLHESLDLEAGPLMALALLRARGGDADIVILVLHHLVGDAISLRILTEDIEHAYRELRQGRSVETVPVRADFASWSRLLGERARDPQLDAERSFWLDQACALPAEAHRQGPPLPDGAPERRTLELDAAVTRALLEDGPRRQRARVDELLLTAFVRAHGRWSSQPQLLVDMEAHGRDVFPDDLDVSGVVGWFTTRYPLLLGGTHADAAAALAETKSRMRSVPRGGIGYGLLRYLSPNADVRADLARLPRPPVSFNYLGRHADAAGGDALLRVSGMRAAGGSSARNPLNYELKVDGWVRSGRLTFDLRCAPDVHAAHDVDLLVRYFAAELRGVSHLAQEGAAPQPTVADFPYAGIGQGDLERLLKNMGR
jgi:amino acid adenylation domain-containing protein/non-ribosomal peptide synthase protein (TIGR01720 family)